MKTIGYVTGKSGEFEKKEFFSASSMAGAVKAQILPPVSQDFMGFGVAITASSCYNLAKMDRAARQKFLGEIFGKEGLGLSVARFSVASSDYSPELYSYDDVPGDTELVHFSVDRDREYVIPMIQEILDVNPDLYLFASPWSPPGWMKTGGSMCGGAMQAEYLETYAEYLIRFLREYEAEGIEIRALTPQNEPETQQGGKMPACYWSPELEAKFVHVLRNRLIEEGMDVGIWFHDHNYNYPRVEWLLDKDFELQDDASGIAFHYYGGGPENTEVLREKGCTLPFHMTEGGPRLDDRYDTDWCKWSAVIAETLGRGFSSFSGWNLMLDETGGPNIGPFNCGGLVTRNKTTGALANSGQLKAFRHFAPYVSRRTKIHPVKLKKAVCMRYFPPKIEPLYGLFMENESGPSAMVLVNPWNSVSQVEFTANGETYYVGLEPDSVVTVEV